MLKQAQILAITLILLPLSALGIPVTGDEFDIIFHPGTSGGNPVGGTGMFTLGPQDNGNFMIADFEFMFSEVTYSSSGPLPIRANSFTYDPIGNLLTGDLLIPCASPFCFGVSFRSQPFYAHGQAFVLHSLGLYTITPKDDGPVPVPEPGTLSLLVAALLGFGLIRLRKRVA